jgi:periodic tryptophan protein 1
MISSLAWVPRGAMKRVPLAHDATPDAVAGARARAAARAADSSDEDDDAPLVSSRDPALASLADVKLPPGFEEEEAAAAAMDEDAAAGGGGGAAARAAAAAAAALRGGGGGGGGGGGDDDDDDDDASDVGDMEASASDAFVLVANTTDDFSNLEVYVYNEADGNLFVRHDITLPSFPLSLAWADYAGDAAGGPLLRAGGAAPTAGGESYVGSFCAVGTFDPAIEIWCLDVVDPLEPTLVLRGAKKGKKGGDDKKRRGGKGGAGAGAGVGAGAGGVSATEGHSAAVIGLSWNKAHRHLLASGSADGTAKVWDVDGGGRVLHTYTHHRSKVQSVAWNPAEPSVLAMASDDLTMSVTDARCPEAQRIARYALTADPEALLWYPHKCVAGHATRACGTTRD